MQTGETNIRQAKSTAQDQQKTSSPKKLKLNSPAPKKEKSNKAWDWEDDLNDADLSRLHILLKEETNKKRHIWA